MMLKKKVLIFFCIYTQFAALMSILVILPRLKVVEWVLFLVNSYPLKKMYADSFKTYKKERG